MTSLDEFHREVERLAAVIAAPASRLPTYGRSEDGARPHIEYAGGQFHFVVIERGQELERVSSADAQAILYEVFNGVTFGMASDFEVRHRRRGEDSRVQLFEKQLELMHQLSPDWHVRLQKHLAEVLRRHPYVHSGG